MPRAMPGEQPYHHPIKSSRKGGSSSAAVLLEGTVMERVLRRHLLYRRRVATVCRLGCAASAMRSLGHLAPLGPR